MNSIEQLSPALIWKHFYQLTQCPRPSKKEDKAIEYIRHFCKSQQLECLQDEIGNVIIRKAASPNAKTDTAVILQGHIDMVCQKNNDTEHDFENDPIETYIDGDWVTAKGTTLGADNGMGVAAALAVLESDIPHGPLEVLLTIDEETGMTGAKNLDQTILKGDVLLNLDSEGEGKVYVGCAGGINITSTFNISKHKLTDEQAYAGMQLSITGLQGGHSGLDIDKGRGNANKLITRILREWIIEHKLPIYVANINGGNLRNAIPREAFVELLIPENSLKAANDILADVSQQIKNELSSVEPNPSIKLTNTETTTDYIDSKQIESIIRALDSCPNGVVRMCPSVPGVPETSNNLASISCDKNTITVQCMTRSFIDSARNDTAASITSAFEAGGATTDRSGEYPGWQPNLKSNALAYVQHAYETLFGRKPEVNVIHAGLECGLLSKAYPNWDIASFGPTIEHAHSPDEKVHIESVQRFWDLLVYVLTNIRQ